MAEENKKKYLDYVGTRKLVENIKEYVDSHTENKIMHITANERTDWDSAKTHADSNHAPSDAEKNQNAFSNIKVGDKTIIADTATDTLTLVAGDNVTILPDEIGDSITISAKNTEITVDAELKDNSTNPVQNKIIKSALDKKANKIDLDEKAELEHSHDVATNSKNGFMSSADKKKLDEISEGADSVLFEQKLTTGVEVGTITINEESTTLYAPANTNTTYDLTATQASNENVKLNLTASGSGSGTDSIEIKGSGATNVYRDTNSGAIVIESSDNNTTYYPAGNSLGLVKSGGDVTISGGIITVNGKADENHTHDDRYYTETEIDTKLEDKADKTHNHDNSYYGKSDGETLADTLAEVKKDVDDFFKDALGDTDAQQVKDTLREIQDYITSDVAAAASMTASIKGKAEKEHTHVIADVTNLKTALDDKASQSDLDAHIDRKDNPHEVTLNQLGVTATAQELNILDGASIVVDELNFVKGTTSNIQGQLDGKAPLVHNHETDWNNSTTTDDGYIANKPPIKKGSGTDSIVVGSTADAKGQYSAAGGTNDKNLVSDLIGSSALGSLFTSIDKPTAYGDMSLSFGAGTKSYTIGSVALGANATAGCLGFYWYNIDFSGTNPVITLSTQQHSYPLFGSTLNARTWDSNAETQLNKWSAGDVITIVNNVKYGEKATITKVEADDGKITVESLPFTSADVSISKANAAKYLFDDCAVYVPSKPENGIAKFALGALSIGLQTNAAGSFSSALGYGSKVTTDFGHAEGRDTVAGYAAHAEGSASKALGIASHAEGQSIAEGELSHSEGQSTARGKGSHAEGYSCDANGQYSHAEGYDTDATGNYAHAEGQNTFATSTSDHAEGLGAKATGGASHAEGFYAHATALYSHAEGQETVASKQSSHAEGRETHADGNYSHSEGFRTSALNEASHTEGYQTTALGMYSHAEGGSSNPIPTNENGIITDGIELINKHKDKDIKFSAALGHQSHSEGLNTLAIGARSHSEGRDTIAEGVMSHAEGNQTHAQGESSHAEGNQTHAQGIYSHSEGSNTSAIGMYSHAEGLDTHAKNESSHTEGCGTEARGKASHAEGDGTKSYSHASHAEGYSTTAAGDYSHAEGQYSRAECPAAHAEGHSTANGTCAHAEGQSTAIGESAHAEGHGTEAHGKASHAEGHHSIASAYAHAEGQSIANGSFSHSEGYNTVADGTCAHTEGYGTLTGMSGYYIIAFEEVANYSAGEYKVDKSELRVYLSKEQLTHHPLHVVSYYNINGLNYYEIKNLINIPYEQSRMSIEEF